MADQITPEQKQVLNRRRLLAGAAMAPVLLSVPGKPVLAGQLCSLSGFASGNLSGRPRDSGCNGRSPGYWMETPGAWPSPYNPGHCAGGFYGNGKCSTALNYANATKIHDPVLGFSGSKYKNFSWGGKPAKHWSMMEYLRTFQASENALVWHLIAALMNAKAGFAGYSLTVNEVKDIWDQLITQGKSTYDTATVHMSKEKVLQFLKLTYHDDMSGYVPPSP